MSMKEKKVKVESDLGSIPEIKTIYWYIRSGYYAPFIFVLCEEEWTGSTSDLYRLAKGNVYLNRDEAEETLDILNSRLERLKLQALNARQEERLAEEKARKKAEAAERKRLREEENGKEKKKLTQKEKAAQYESGKKKRAKKSPHPDIIV